MSSYPNGLPIGIRPALYFLMNSSSCLLSERKESSSSIAPTSCHTSCSYLSMSLMGMYIPALIPSLTAFNSISCSSWENFCITSYSRTIVPMYSSTIPPEINPPTRYADLITAWCLPPCSAILIILAAIPSLL